MFPRISIAGLMALVLVAGIGSAMVVFAARGEHVAVVSATTLLLAGATAAATIARGPARAFAATFAVVGWLGMLRLETLTPLAMLELPTSRTLVRLYEIAHRPPAPPGWMDPSSSLYIDDLHAYLRIAYAIAVVFIAAVIAAIVGLAALLARRRAGRAVA